MSDVPILVEAFAAGAFLGGVFYGGLWWTVRRVAAKSQPLWLFGSFLVRSTLALVGFYPFARTEWQGLAVCFLGFLGARILVSYLVRTSAEKSSRIAQRARP